jgi:hypothetical protein
MWQQLLEIVLFYQSKRHRKPVDILKSFISGSHETVPALPGKDQGTLRSIFEFISQAYKTSDLRTTSLATDQTHFYTMITSLIAGERVTRSSPQDLTGKLVALGHIIDKKRDRPARLSEDSLKECLALSKDRTTDSPRRDERQRLFLEAVDAL